MALGKDKGKIVKFGGGVLKAQLVDDAGGTPTTIYDLGFVDEVGLTYTSETEDRQDETGNTVASLPGDTKVKLTGVFLQTDTELLDFLRDNTIGYYYRIYHKMTAKNAMNGKTQEFFGGIGVVKPMFEIKSKTKRIPFEINFLKNDSAISMTGLTTALGSAADTATVDAEKYYELVETTEV